MTPLRIFISSAQAEFAEERAALRDYVRGDPLIRRFFDVFRFEDAPASDRRPDQLYLDEVERCDIYVGLFGTDYGNEDEEGVSPTEREFDRATDRGSHRLVFVKGADDARHPKMRALIRKAQAGLIRKRFHTTAELVAGLYAALVEYLEERELLRWGPFDAAPCVKATPDDLDDERMAQFVRTAREVRQLPLPEGTLPERLLEHLNLLNDGRLTNAAVLLFGRTPQRFFISSEIRCAHYHGTEVAKPIPSYQIYKGTVFDLVDQAVDFVLSKINRSIGTRTESARAARTYEIPVGVVTEAIVNAVAHRDYTSNGSVQIMLFADRLEVRNPGRLPTTLTLEKLREAHSSVPGNPLLAESLYLTKYIERMGTGTLDMIRLCTEAGLAEPEFAVTDGFVTTIRRVRGPGHVPGHAMGAEVAAADSEATGCGPPTQVGDQAAIQANDTKGQAEGQEGGQAVLSANQITILRACHDGAVSAETLSAAVGHNSGTGHFKRLLRPLLSEGFLEMTVPDRPTSAAQQYRLTDKGQAAIAPDGSDRIEGEVVDAAGGQVGGQARGQVEGQAKGQGGGRVVLSAKDVAMLQACLHAPVAADVLVAAAGNVGRTGRFRRCLQRLLHDELLEMTVPEKPRSPAQKYRLTDTGRVALQGTAEVNSKSGR